MRTAAIIGHGPSPTGRGWGKEIDRCGAVIRMFDCAWQTQSDYGVKLDYALITMSRRALTAFQLAPLRVPREWWVYCDGTETHKLTTSRPQRPFRLDYAHDLAMDLGTKTTGGKFGLTRGTAAACFAAELLDVDRIILVGFDEVVTGKFSAAPYSNACLQMLKTRPDFNEISAGSEDWRAGKTASAGHDMSVELGVIKAVCDRYGCEVKTADRLWG